MASSDDLKGKSELEQTEPVLQGGMATMQEQNVAVREKTVKQPQIKTQVTMNNVIQFAMTLDRSNNWLGSPVGTFPAIFFSNNNATFTHSGNYLGSEAAVVYNGKNAANIDCSWVLAWYAPAENTPNHPSNKVYVVCGPKQDIDKLPFEQILQSLDHGSTSSTFTDPATRTSVSANISDTVSDSTTLVAHFELIP